MAELKTATFGAGCFWGVEDAFMKIPGVKETAVGFMGGHVEDPSYEKVCAGSTGHAEVTQVTYDPDEVSYEDLLEIFWKVHDPTQVDRQGPDVGRQYRSVIFYHDDEQKAAAETSKRELEASGKHDKPVATAIESAGPFYRAEEYHQKYFQKNPGRKIC